LYFPQLASPMVASPAAHTRNIRTRLVMNCLRPARFNLAAKALLDSYSMIRTTLDCNFQTVLG
jgi:hypothetical protein